MRSATSGATVGQLRDLFGAGATAGVDDGRLLARYADSGDNPAFAALVARHGPMVLATARAVLKHEHDVEDAFQATFLVLARKAGSIRGADALGGWLHRVAHRAAVEASLAARRRRDRERDLATIPPRPGLPAGPDFDVKAILHEEIDRLPESRRLPVVLRDLEGLTYEEAARRLRWTVPTLRSRLAKARHRLRARLTGRGVDAAALPLLAARAAVPEALARSATSAGAVALTRHLLRGMLMTQIKTAATLALAALALATAGLVALARVGRDETRPTPTPVATPRDAPPPSPKPGEMIEVRGRVVAPDGKPVAGATVTPGYHDKEIRPVPEATSGPDGAFLIRMAWSPRQAGQVDPGRFPWLVASAPGFGPGHAAGVLRPENVGPIPIRLVEEGPPIEGRIVDLEGRPVAGARVRSDNLYGPTGGDLGPWLARGTGRGGHGPFDGLKYLPWSRETRTDAAGRFRLGGIGRDRVARMVISGPTIATEDIYARNRPGPDITHPVHEVVSPRTITFHGARFDHAAAPTRPVRGVARDADTGRPIAGLVIQGAVFDPRSNVPDSEIEATTDAGGRYELAGLPGAAAYRIVLRSPRGARGLPYPNANLRAPAEAPGLGPVTFDFALKRGVVVRGRVTDRRTGRPVPGHVNAFLFPDNPHLGAFPGFAEGQLAYAYLDADGRYEIVAPPGRAIIACRSDMARYRTAVGSESIEGPRVRDRRTFATVPRECYDVNYHILAAVDLDPKAGSATVDLQVEPGRTLELNVLDPEGRPLAGTVSEGTAAMFPDDSTRQDSPTFEVRSLLPGQWRRVTVRHRGRKLAGSIFLRGDEAGPLTLKLQPWAELTGRVLDDEGKPRAGLRLGHASADGPDKVAEVGVLPGATSREGAAVGPDGRFHADGLVPGLRYGASALEGGEITVGDLFLGVTLAPGEARDLGDLKVTPLKPPVPR